jgi:hypothetical protein
MNKRMALAASVATTAIAAMGASTASAYTVTGGPNFTGTAATTTLTNNNTGAALTCASSNASGTVNTGTGVGPTLGSISALSFAGGGTCSGPAGISFTVTPNSLPYPIVATGPTAGGVTPGRVTGVNARLSGFLCSATVTGSAPGNYNNATRRLTLTAGSTLTISNVSGCFGLLNNGDTASFTTAYNVVGSPANPIQINN